MKNPRAVQAIEEAEKQEPVAWMNKRIKELAEQATEPPVFPANVGYFDREKFAELIIEECIVGIENEAAQYAEPVWAVKLVNDIKEHFGVKYKKENT